MPYLSIIIPVYNKEDYIEGCIDSILSQTFSDFELILVNDGSTDSSGKKCDHYYQLDSRVKVVNQFNQGVSAARNTGLELATGKYIGFVDSDDTIEPDMYETLINTAIQNEGDIAVCGVKKIFPDKEVLYYGTNKTVVYNRDEALIALLKRDIAHSIYDKIYKLEVIKGIKFEKRMYEDVLYNFLAIDNSNKITFYDVTKYNYIIRDNSVSMSKFGSIYMDTLYCSEKIVQHSVNKQSNIYKEAQIFDFITNISVYNLLLMVDKEPFEKEYNTLLKNILNYKKLVDEKALRKKHIYAYHLIKINPSLYSILMKLYCRIFDADLMRKS